MSERRLRHMSWAAAGGISDARAWRGAGQCGKHMKLLSVICIRW
jgi:hypothetical protein